VLIDRGRPANTYQITGAYGAAVADLPFPGRAGKDSLDFHGLLSTLYFIASKPVRLLVFLIFYQGEIAKIG
jgi:hypothetical protein